MADLTTILLAAGLSRRMGGCNKLLLPISDVPMVRHMVDVYRAATQGRIVVVTGHQAHAIETALEGSGAETCFNADFAQGQSTSVVCGLRAARAADDVLIGLADQPVLSVEDIRALLAAHRAAEGAADRARISIPAIDDKRGNPIVVPACLRARLLSDPRSPGCKTFTRTHPDQVQFHPLTSPGFYTDVDTPEAYAHHRARSQEAIL